MPFIVTTYIYASSQGHRTHSARTNSLLVTSCVSMSLFQTKCGSTHLDAQLINNFMKKQQYFSQNVPDSLNFTWMFLHFVDLLRTGRLHFNSQLVFSNQLCAILQINIFIPNHPHSATMFSY
jgi:hypothetical protein